MPPASVHFLHGFARYSCNMCTLDGSLGRCALVGKLPHGGVSERPKEHASKACDG
jgi:hypothetical protein